MFFRAECTVIAKSACKCGLICGNNDLIFPYHCENGAATVKEVLGVQITWLYVPRAAAAQAAEKLQMKRTAESLSPLSSGIN